ncbi:cyanophycin synthetase [Clostridiaceae bacterium 35-E11]
MKIISIRALPGRNAYSHHSVIKMTVDLEVLYQIPTMEIPNFNEKLINILPTLKEHKCSEGYKGGFIARLQRGTYLAHVLEHIAIELQNLMGYSISYGKARRDSSPTVYNIIFSYMNEVAGIEAGKLAFRIVNELIEGNEITIKEEIKNIKNKALKIELGPSTKAIEKAARQREIPVMRIGKGSLLQLGYGAKSKLIQATLTENASCIAVDIACDKELTNHLLHQNNIPVPMGEIAYTEEDAVEIAKDIGYPVVAKPFNGNQGKYVFLNLNTDEQLVKAYKTIYGQVSYPLIEKHIYGDHFRILVVKDKVVAAAQRIPAHVIGDGIHSIKTLIDIENENPKRGEGHEKALTKIKIDEVLLFFLKKNNKTLASIPYKGETVYLRENDNLSTGGTAIDVTDKVHEDVKKICVKAAAIIGLDVAGVDITTTDITKPLSETRGAIIEVNAAPGIRMHHDPSLGMARNVAKEIVASLFSEEYEPIPVISVSGTNGKTTTTRMIRHILKEAGYNVGMAVTGGIYIGDECVEVGDTTGPSSARRILMDKTVTAAVLETARGGIINRGLGYDLADIGIITNITDDHLGIDGIETLEEMAHLKAVVVEAIKKQGYGILNADDRYCLAIKDRVFGKLILFSKHADNIHILKHLEEGGNAVYLKNQIIYLANKQEQIPVMNIKDIPATYGGILIHNVENSLAAIAGAWGMGIEIERIQTALKKFKSDERQNPGRFNIYDIGDFKVIVDYGHNYEGYKRIIEGLHKMKANKLIGVIGVPGDRLDANIYDIGILSGKSFDHIFIKEDRDLRGRKPREVANLLYQGCIDNGKAAQQLEIELLEDIALEKAINIAKAGDIIVVFYEKREKIMEIIHFYQQQYDMASGSKKEILMSM